MNASMWMTLVAIVIGSGTALTVGYFHRRNQWEIEAFKKGVPVGDVRPKPLLNWPKLALAFLWLSAMEALVISTLVVIMTSAAPLTKGIVLSIAMNVSVVLFNLALFLIFVLGEMVFAGRK